MQNGWSRGVCPGFYLVHADLCVANGLVLRQNRIVIPQSCTRICFSVLWQPGTVSEPPPPKQDTTLRGKAKKDMFNQEPNTHCCHNACVFTCVCVYMHECLHACVLTCMCVYMRVCGQVVFLGDFLKSKKGECTAKPIKTGPLYIVKHLY